MTAILRETAYMYAEDVTPEGRKTRIVAVRAQSNGSPLGTIQWWGAWSQYTFMPATGTVFNVACLTDIQRWIKTLMADRRPAET